jgi:hypothetical protein
MVAAALVGSSSEGALAANASKAQVCEAAKLLAAGNKAQCLAREQAKALQGQAANVANCDRLFTNAFAKAERNAGPGTCPTEGDTAAIELMVDTCTADIANALAGTLPAPGPTMTFPATGQTTCWEHDRGPGQGVLVISCAGTGQDGAIQAGAALSYTDNGDGTITDNNTGLMWEKKSDDGTIHDKDTAYRWTTAFSAHIAGLNAGAGFAGYTDWRLPNVRELQSIVNYETFSPGVSAAFNSNCAAQCTVLTCSCAAPIGYWSSTSVAYHPSQAWVVENGAVGSVEKVSTLFVRAVRGGL